MRFAEFNNSKIAERSISADGENQYFRKPIFDIKISAEKQSSYQKNAQNEIAVTLYNMGMFDPQRIDVTLPCLKMMQFEGKEELIETLSKNASIYDKLNQMLQLVTNCAGTVGGELGAALMASAQQICQ